MPDSKPIDPKVWAGSGGALVGGGALAYMIVWLLKFPFALPEAWFTDQFLIALTAICGAMAGFIGGYLKRQ